MAPSKPQWQVDRHINVATIFSIAVFMVGQFIGGILWVSSVSSRLDGVERKVERLDAIMGPIVERSIRVETRLDALIENTARIQTTLTNSSILTYIPGQPLPGTDPRPMKPALTR